MSQIYKASSGGGGGGIITIDGDVGSVTGNPILFSGINSGSTIKFVGSGTEMDLNVADLQGNLLLGDGAGNPTLSGSQNIGLGESVGQNLTSGGQNTMLGALAASSITSGNSSVFVGFISGQLVTTGGLNVFLGAGTGKNLVSGNQNLLLGYQSGINYTGSESNNILLNNDGVLGESNIIRLGTVGQQTTTYLAGQVLAEFGTNGAPGYSFQAATDSGMLTDGTNTYIAGSGFATGSFGFNVTLSGGITTITQGVVQTGISTKTANFTTDYNTVLYLVDVTTGSAAITAQIINSPIVGQIYTFKDVTGAASTFNITISGSVAGVTIDGSTTFVMNVNFGALTIQCTSATTFVVI